MQPIQFDMKTNGVSLNDDSVTKELSRVCSIWQVEQFRDGGGPKGGSSESRSRINSVRTLSTPGRLYVLVKRSWYYRRKAKLSKAKQKKPPKITYFAVALVLVTPVAVNILQESDLSLGEPIANATVSPVELRCTFARRQTGTVIVEQACPHLEVVVE